MKFINQLQGGGSASLFVQSTFLDPYTPETKKTTTKESSSKNSESNDYLEQVKFISSLMKDSLPGDVMQVSKYLEDAMRRASIMSKDARYDSSQIATVYLKALREASKLPYYKRLHEKATDTAAEKDSLNTAVINDRGQVLVSNQGEMYWKLPEQLIDEDRITTNQELLNMRAHGYGDSALTQTFSNIVLGSTSFKEIEQYLRNAVSSLGTDKYTDLEFVNKQELQQAYKELQQAKEQNPGATIEELYKLGTISATQQNQMNQLMLFLWRSLPVNAKALLKLNAGGDHSEIEGIQLMQHYIGSKTSTIQGQNGGSKVTTGGKTGSSSKSEQNKEGYKSSFVLAVQNGKGTYEGVFSLNNKSNIAMSTVGSIYESVLDKDGKHIGKTSMETMLGDSGLRSITIGNMYLGQQKIELDQLDRIMYDGTGIMRVLLPSNNDGSPKFDLLEEYTKAYNEYLLSNQTEQDKQRIFGNNKKLNYLINSNGNWDLSKFTPYLLVNGITTDKLINIEKTNNYITKKKDPLIIQDLQYTLTKGTGNNAIVPDLDAENWYESDFLHWLNPFDTPYKGTLFIPINMNKASALLGSDQSVDIEVFNKQEEAYQQRDIKGESSSNVLK